MVDPVLHVRVRVLILSHLLPLTCLLTRYISAFGVYQDYYTRVFLSQETPSNIRCGIARPVRLDSNEPKFAALKLDRELPAFHAICPGFPSRSGFRRGIFVGP